jgi:hypothetical protein
VTALRWLLRVAGAVLLIGIAVVHARLWSDGYRSLDVIGPLFIVNAVGATVLAIAVLLAPLRYLALVALAGAALAAGTAAGLLLTTQVEVFGFKESLEAPDAVLSLWLEGAATVVLLALAALSFRSWTARTATRTPHRTDRRHHTLR